MWEVYVYWGFLLLFLAFAYHFTYLQPLLSLRHYFMTKENIDKMWVSDKILLVVGEAIKEKEDSSIVISWHGERPRGGFMKMSVVAFSGPSK